jgi:hypothetical protein
MAGLAASAFHLMVACCRISCSARYLARRAWEIRPRQRYPARKPKGKPIKAAIAKSNILVPGTLIGSLFILNVGVLRANGCQRLIAAQARAGLRSRCDKLEQ